MPLRPLSSHSERQQEKHGAVCGLPVSGILCQQCADGATEDSAHLCIKPTFSAVADFILMAERKFSLHNLQVA